MTKESMYFAAAPSGILRRFAQLLAFLILLVFMESHFTIIRQSDFVKNTLGVLGTLRNQQHVRSGPLHVLLVAYARTGSSFVGDLMQSLPNSFYHFEPLHFIRGPVFNDSFDEARGLLGNLFLCNISKIEGFLPWQIKHKQFMKLQRNIRYWKECNKTTKIRNAKSNAMQHKTDVTNCYNGKYIDSYCHNQTDFVIAKTIRLNLLEASKMFNTHPHLNLKIIYLTRDPRGTMNSRMKKPVNSWCKHDPQCFNSTQFCSSISNDVRTACSLWIERPEDFMVIRYEDVSLDPYGIAQQLVQFLGIASVPNEIQEFLKTHTFFTGNIRRRSKAEGLDPPYTTYRNSSITAMSWRKEAAFEQIKELQKKCLPFLKAFGYHYYRTQESLRGNNDMNMELHTALGSICDVS